MKGIVAGIKLLLAVRRASRLGTRLTKQQQRLIRQRSRVESLISSHRESLDLVERIVSDLKSLEVSSVNLQSDNNSMRAGPSPTLSGYQA